MLLKEKKKILKWISETTKQGKNLMGFIIQLSKKTYKFLGKFLRIFAEGISERISVEECKGATWNWCLEKSKHARKHLKNFLCKNAERFAISVVANSCLKKSLELWIIASKKSCEILGVYQFLLERFFLMNFNMKSWIISAKQHFFKKFREKSQVKL